MTNMLTLDTQSGNESESLNAFAIAQQQLDAVAKLIELDPGIHRVLRVPRRELTVNFPVQMDSGDTKVFTGYRVSTQPLARPRQRRHPLPPPKPTSTKSAPSPCG